MKKLSFCALFAVVLCLFAGIFYTGCTTSSQNTAYATIGSIEATAQTGYDGYAALVINGTVSTNSLPTVSQAYNQLQADLLLAATISSSGTNALATTNLVAEAAQLATVISTAEAIK